MNARKIIVIEIQPHYTTIVLHEYGKNIKVGDGYLKHIPNLVSDNAFGSECIKRLSKIEFINPYLKETPKEKLQQYINGLYRLIFNYIGFQDPNYNINKYEVVCIFQSEEITPALTSFSGILKNKFKGAEIFLSNTVFLGWANLYKGFAATNKSVLVQDNILVIHIGEQNTDLLLIDTRPSQAQIKKHVTIKKGWFQWYHKAFEYFKKAFGPSIPLNPVLFLENMTEFLAHYANSNKDASHTWDGPYAHLLKQNLGKNTFKQADLHELAGINTYLSELINTLETVLKDVPMVTVWQTGTGNIWFGLDNISILAKYEVNKLYDFHGYELHIAICEGAKVNETKVQAPTVTPPIEPLKTNPIPKSSSWDWIDKDYKNGY